jgi:hypothetical protein
MNGNYPTENDRIINPYNNERPTFLPGDKVRYDLDNKIYRIVGRVANEMSELMTFRDVNNDFNEFKAQSDKIIPHLEMVAMYKK